MQKQEHSRCQAALIAGFAALLLGPALLWVPLRPLMDTQNHENRTLAAMPGAGTPLRAWPAAFEDWLGDHAPFRNEFLTLKAGADRLLGALDSTDVLLGAGGWLFLKDVGDSSSISDYQGLTAYTPEEQAGLAAALTELQQMLAARGTQLAVLLAPAKEGVCSDKMPAAVPVVNRPTRVQALAAYLQAETTVPVVFPLEELRQAAARQQVYYKYDTHWNDAGAWLAAQQVLAALDRPSQSEWPAIVPRPDRAAPTDLANMCGSWRWCTDDVYYEADVPRAAADGDMNAELLHYTGAGTGTLLLVRDSMGAALAPHLAQGFAAALVLHGNVLTMDTLAAQQPAAPDVLVLEVSERYSDNLLRHVRFLQEWAQTLPAGEPNG